MRQALARLSSRSDPFQCRAASRGVSSPAAARRAPLRAQCRRRFWSSFHRSRTSPSHRGPRPAPTALTCSCRLRSRVVASRFVGTPVVRTRLLPRSPPHRQLASSHHPRATSIRPYRSSVARSSPRHSPPSPIDAAAVASSRSRHLREFASEPGRRLSSPISCSLSLSLSFSSLF
ncbi:hypothetical protein Scep_000987 [Stephania cephalantha]|uniref:Uncharacterized protein n=1 Tax=Stephania cephalantha TaxID=152367 RepID=A0AAP0L7L1_9MAGN